MAYLHEAIKGYFAYPQVKWILAHGADVNAPDEDGNLPLALSMEHFAEHHTVVKGLLRRGASLDARNRQGLTALMVALDYSNIEGAELLAGRYRRRRIRPAVDPTIDNGRLALLYAAFKGDVKAARQLLDAGTDPNARNSAAQTPIMMAVRANQPGALRLLLERGADPNVMDVDGRKWTALHMAASDGLTECARLLLEHGAEVNSRDDCQRTPLFEIAFSSSAPTCKVLLDFGADIHACDEEGDTALVEFAWLADEEVIRMLLDRGAGENRDILRRAFRACFTDNNHDKAPILRNAGLAVGLAEWILLETYSGSDRWNSDFPPNEATYRALADWMARGVTREELERALCTAVSHTKAEIVQFLLDHGADPNTSCSGDSPLHRAFWNIYNGDKVVETLLRAGADVNAKDRERGATPLVASQQFEFIRRFVELGADLNIADKDGRTALMNAVWAEKHDDVTILLELGADVNARDKEGKTALHVAALNGDARMARLLLKSGASPNVEDNRGRTPLNVAERWVGKAIADLIRSAIVHIGERAQCGD